jgi:hypothetical protein
MCGAFWYKEHLFEITITEKALSEFVTWVNHSQGFFSVFLSDRLDGPCLDLVIMAYLVPEQW